MKFGIVSDIHANIDALEAVVNALAAQGVDRYVCLGDTIGYGAAPEACVRLLQSLDAWVILGNHDAAGAGLIDANQYYEAAREAIFYGWGKLPTEDRDWLAALPLTRSHEDILFCHGAPHAPDQFEYLFAPEHVQDYPRDYDLLPRITFIGHSHLTICFEIAKRRAIAFFSPEFTLNEGRKYVVTAGSVGQPRDRDPRACALVYDDAEQSVQFLRVPYDIAAAQAKIMKSGLSAHFASRLARGV